MELRERVALALWEAAFEELPEPLRPVWDEADDEEREVTFSVAQRVLDAVGLERVGCVNAVGRLVRGHFGPCDHEPVYRLSEGSNP